MSPDEAAGAALNASRIENEASIKRMVSGYEHAQSNRAGVQRRANSRQELRGSRGTIIDTIGQFFDNISHKPLWI
jgi:hypothetical protein